MTLLTLGPVVSPAFIGCCSGGPTAGLAAEGGASKGAGGGGGGNLGRGGIDFRKKLGDVLAPSGGCGA